MPTSMMGGECRYNPQSQDQLVHMLGDRIYSLFNITTGLKPKPRPGSGLRIPRVLYGVNHKMSTQGEVSPEREREQNQGIKRKLQFKMSLYKKIPKHMRETKKSSHKIYNQEIKKINPSKIILNYIKTTLI